MDRTEALWRSSGSNSNLWNFTELKEVIKVFFFNQSVFIQQAPITVLNGTSTKAVDVKTLP